MKSKIYNKEEASYMQGVTTGLGVGALIIGGISLFTGFSISSSIMVAVGAFIASYVWKMRKTRS